MTLLELMATLAIFGALLAMLGGVFMSSVNARDSVERNLSIMKRAHGVMEIIVRDIEDMHAFDSRAYFLAEVNSIADTEATNIAFPTVSPLRVMEALREKPGLMEIAYLTGEDPNHEGTLRLFRRELEVETDSSATAIRLTDEGLVLLSDRLAGFKITFLSADEAEAAAERNAEPVFVEQWEGGFGPEKLPVAIRVALTMSGEGPDSPRLEVKRTLRLPTQDVEEETLQAKMKEAMGIEDEQ